MQFGFFLQEGFNGVLTFSHDYFKKAVQTLLLAGINVLSEDQFDPSLPPCRQNISKTQKSLHVSTIIEILKYQIHKDDFDLISQIDNDNETDCTELTLQYLEIIHELIYHLYIT